MYTKSIAIAASFVLMLTPAALAAERMFYTEESIAGARANVESFDWARAEKEVTLAYAKTWMQMSDDQVWNFLSEQTIPRAIFVSKPPRCPIHGSLEAYGEYAWRTVPEHRWKLRCPIGQEMWPTNDFEAFYRSGKDTNYIFRSERANRSVLYSTDPARPYGVDDGTGYVDSAGNRSYFVAYYAFWGIWNQVTRADYNAVTVLSQAYLLTGDPSYAHKAALLIARAADLYDPMHVAEWTRLGIPANDGGTHLGKVLGAIWDDEVAVNLMLAWDAVAPAIEKDPELQAFLGAKSRQYGLRPQGSAAQIRQHVETGLLKPILSAVENLHIRSNECRAQRAIAMAGAMLGAEAWKRAQAWLQQPGDKLNGGGHLPDLFWSYIDRDGAGNEGSPYYNSLWLSALLPLAHVMQLAGEKNFFDTYTHLKRLVQFPGRLTVLGRYYPHIGDSGTPGRPEPVAPDLLATYVRAYQQTKDPLVAVAAYRINGESFDGLHAGLFDADYRKLNQEIAAQVSKYGRLSDKSDNLNAYGLAIHRAGRKEWRRAMWLYWGRTSHGGNHPHADRLNLGLYAYGLDLLPDLGYPEYAIAWPSAQGWTKNTVAHNTVVVDGRRQTPTPTGDQRVFADTPRVQFSEVDGGAAYPHTSLYRRSAAMIQIDNERSYVVDLFRVKGGREHVYSFHAAEGDVTTQGLTIERQPGTYAGSNVPFGSFYDEPFSGQYSGSGFQFLDNVETAAGTPSSFAVDWKIRDVYGMLPAALKDRVHVRMTMVGNEGQVALATGYTTKDAPMKRLRYLLVKNTGAPAHSRFASVIEPYAGDPAVQSVELLPLAGNESKDVVAMKISLATGRTDYIFSSLDQAEHATADGRYKFKGAYAVYAERHGVHDFAFLADGGSLSVDGKVVAEGISPTGKVTNVNVAADGTSILDVEGNVPDDGSFVNRWLDIRTDGQTDGNYLAVSVEPNGAYTRIKLATDPIVGFNKAGDYGSGFRLNIQLGAAFRFPALVYERGDAYEMLEGETETVDEPVVQPQTQSSESDGCATQRVAWAWGVLLALPLLIRRVRHTLACN